MAGIITVTPEINGQVASSSKSYCYLYEPLRVQISESDSTATKVYIDVWLYDLDGTPYSAESQYAVFDIAGGNPITIDLMKIAQQLTDSNIYKFSQTSEINPFSILATYWFEFRIYTDKTSTPISVKKIPIVGLRNFDQFVANVVYNTAPMDEFEYYGLNRTELEQRWEGLTSIRTTLIDPTIDDIQPTITEVTSVSPEKTPCGGSLIWKSRFGGWMFWGMDLKKETINHNYQNALSVGVFESTLETAGNPYVPVDYGRVSTSYSYSLKALSLSQDELLAVSGIGASPAIYYQKQGSSQLELMRMTSFNAPIDSLANGGDFSVSLKSIPKLIQNTI